MSERKKFDEFFAAHKELVKKPRDFFDTLECAGYNPTRWIVFIRARQFLKDEAGATKL